jgi:hypothetical protein
MIATANPRSQAPHRRARRWRNGLVAKPRDRKTVAHATGTQMQWNAVSDIDADVLSAFLGQLARGGN